MSVPLVVTHPCALLHDGLRGIFSKSRFRPVRIALTLNEELEAYLRSLSNGVWLAGVERSVPATSDLVQRMVTKTPGLKVVILASDQRPDDIVAALKAGACGFLRQDIPGDTLIRSLELIALGEMSVYPQCSWADTAVGNVQTSTFTSGTPEPLRSQVNDVVPSLSRCEMLILRMLMEGASNKVIARRLVITESTVKVHMKAILRKLRLQNRTQAAIWARDRLNGQDMKLQTSQLETCRAALVQHHPT